MTTSSYPFVSARARARYLQRYDERARTFPVPSQERMVETAAGQTFVRVFGPPGAPSLVLLPSASASSLMWASMAEGLARRFRVYAVDNIYDFGRSVSRGKLRTPDDYTDWLDGLFDALALGDEIALGGLSYGAWLSAQYALRFGSRLRATILMAPPGTIQPLPGAWAWYGLTALLPHRHFLWNMVRWMFPVLSASEDEADRRLVADLVEDAYLGIRCFKLRMPASPTVLTDAELQRLSQVPTLFLVGELEVIYPAEAALARLRAVAPAIDARIVPGAGHDLTLVRSAMIVEAMEGSLLG